MINHVYTLLCNSRKLEYCDGDYSPITLPRQLLSFKTAIIDKLDLRAVLPVLHMSQLVYFTLYFDSRITYPLTAELSSTTANIAPAVSTMDTLLLDYNILNAIFKPVSRGNVTQLYNIWSQSHNKVTGIGAVLLSYAYQLENLRG